MSSTFKFISWTPYKKRFDLVMLGLIVLYLAAYTVSLYSLYPNIQPQLLIIKSTGSLAIIMLHFILMIGPLARIDTRLLPILYNRRHLGVTMFFIALIHGVLSMLYYQGFGIISPLEALFTINQNFGEFEGFPFMVPGFFAFIIFLIMAMTSHDFWLGKFSPRIWKGLHMMVYLAYILVIGHVFTGALQADVHPLMNLFYYAAVLAVVMLHLYAGFQDRKISKNRSRLALDGWIEIGNPTNIADSRAKVVNTHGQSISIFKSDNKLSAVANYCKHQGGPLGEGKIVDGCITCPWHGYQYLPHNGCSPPPFDEKVATYDLKMVDSQVWLNTEANAEGTMVEPLIIDGHSSEITSESFFIGWDAALALELKKFLLNICIALVGAILAIGLLLPRLSEPLKNSEFVYGDIQEYNGILRINPVPRLTIDGHDFLLVDFGKFSALNSIEKYEENNNVVLNQKEVKLRGTLSSYNGRNIIELSEKEASIIAVDEPHDENPDQQSRLEEISITGEIVDPKCFFGVMNPGDGVVHKSCAALCIKGGIPAVILDNDTRAFYIIRGEQGEDINHQLVPLASETVKLEGNSYIINNWNYINIDSDIKRLSYRNILGNEPDMLCNLPPNTELK